MKGTVGKQGGFLMGLREEIESGQKWNAQVAFSRTGMKGHKDSWPRQLHILLNSRNSYATITTYKIVIQTFEEIKFPGNIPKTCIHTEDIHY